MRHPRVDLAPLRHQDLQTPEDVWDALTDPERLVRWFLPVTGDLRVGGRYSLEGNASGEIVRCEKRREIAVTWEFGGGGSDVRLRLTPDGDMTVFELEQSQVPAEIIPNASPEMWGLGAGWELGLSALGDFLAGNLPEGRATDWIAKATPEELMAAGELSARISDAWIAVIAARRSPASSRTGSGSPATVAAERPPRAGWPEHPRPVHLPASTGLGMP